MLIVTGLCVEGQTAENPLRRLPLSAVAGAEEAGFEPVLLAHTRLAFTNVLGDARVLQNQNLTLGSGVAAGDVDGDGLCDLYFCAIDGRNGLFRNLGGWRFDDITDPSGAALAGNTNTSAALADLDGDRDLDLLVGSLGNGLRLLFNDGRGSFREQTRQAGVEGAAGSLTLAVADVEGDGDLDVYVCHYGAMALVRSSEFQVRMLNGQLQVRGLHSERVKVVNNQLVELGEADTLYLNNGDGTFARAPWNSPAFTNPDGQPVPPPLDFGLAAQFRDVNGDGSPDLYVCNDFQTRDRFWLNDGKGRFREASPRVTRVESYSAMGVDFSDLDRDGHLDFFVVEMLSPDHGRRLRQKSPMAPMDWVPGEFMGRIEVPRNTLFRARGDGTYEELAHYAGVAASDWSWQGSFMDVNLDGFEDLLVVNGHYMDMLDLDDASNQAGVTLRAAGPRTLGARLLTPNRAWLNRGDLTLEDRSEAWGFNDTNICHGMALADLDGDGDLDVAINRLNAPALLLRNKASAPRIAVRLRGRTPNTEGVGAKLVLSTEGVPPQAREVVAGGKYLSHDQTLRVFAAPEAPGRTWNLEVAWRSGARTALGGLEAGFLYDVAEPDTASPPADPSSTPPAPWFEDVSAALAHRHVESGFDDRSIQPLLTRKLSQLGPGVCVVDLDGDGDEDVVVGSGRGGGIAVRWGDGHGAFAAGPDGPPAPGDVIGLAAWAPAPHQRAILLTHAAYEQVTVTNPLELVSWDGSNLVSRPATPARNLYPQFALATCLAVADVDADGDLDVFMGAHSPAGRYPQGGPSQMLRNNDGTLELDRINGPGLLNLGIVNSALWTDLDEDGWPELVVAGEWGSLRLFRNEGGRLREVTASSGLDSHTGWWTGLAAADLDGDGRRDLIAGNWGFNSRYKASPAQPQRLVFGDFMKRSVTDLLEVEYDGSRLEPLPARSLLEVGAAIPLLRLRYPTHRAWSQATLLEVLSELPQPAMAEATTLASTVFLNRGQRFEARPLPREAQMAPVWGVVAADLDGDAAVDLYLAQNASSVVPGQEPANAGRGLLLRGDGRGGFAPVPGETSGLLVYGDQRGAATGDVNGDGRPDLVVTQNGAATRLFLNRQGRAGLRVRLEGPPGNPDAVGAAVSLWGHDKRVGAEQEVRAGGGWLSQGSATLVLAMPEGEAREEPVLLTLQVRWPGGRVTRTAVPDGAGEVVIDREGSDVTN